MARTMPAVQPPDIARKAEQLGMADWSLWSVYDGSATGLRNHWYPVVWSNQLREKTPYPVKLCGERIMLMHDKMEAMARPGTGKTVRDIAVVTVSGGPGVLAADAAERRGLRLTPLHEATALRLSALVPPFAALGNPIDLTPQCPADRVSTAIEAVSGDPGVEAVVAIDCGLDVPGFGGAL